MTKITAAEMRAALKRYYGQPNFGIVFEVAQATGFNARRHLDAMAMGLWPSRGLTLYGIEIKVSLYDWRKELAQPFKAEELARFCDYFYVAAPRDVVPINEVPDGWGLLELRDDKVVEAKAPTKHAAEAIGRPFLAAIFRAASREVDPETLDAMVSKRERQLEERFAERVNEQVELRTKRNAGDGEKWRALLSQLGIENDWHAEADLIPAISAVYRSGVTQTWRGLRSLEKTLAEALEKVREASAELNVPATKDETLKLRKRA